MEYAQIKQAMEETERVLRESENLAVQAIEFAEGRLEMLSKRRYLTHLSSYTLSALKRELRRWDMNRNKWKD